MPRCVRSVLVGLFVFVLGLAPALAASQGYLHDHDRVRTIANQNLEAALATLDAETDAVLISIIRSHFEVEPGPTAHHDGQKEFCCSGVGAICGIALLHSQPMTFAPPLVGFERALSATVKSAVLPALTPPPRPTDIA